MFRSLRAELENMKSDMFRRDRNTAPLVHANSPQLGTAFGQRHDDLTGLIHPRPRRARIPFTNPLLLIDYIREGLLAARLCFIAAWWWHNFRTGGGNAAGMRQLQAQSHQALYTSACTISEVSDASSGKCIGAIQQLESVKDR